MSVVSLIAALGLLRSRLDQVNDASGISRPAPEFDLLSLDGQYFGSEQLRGKAHLLNFWATWCDPCVAEFPLLEETAQRYADELVVVGINQGDSIDDIKSFLTDKKVTFPVLIDKDEKVSVLHKVGGYPTTIFVDAEGIIRAIYLGELPPEQLKKNLRLIGIK